MKIYATLARFIRDSTVAGRALLTAATKADQRAALELGTAAQSAASDFAAAIHAHDDRYFTEAEITSLLTSYLTVSVAGTTYQPLDSDLTAIASLSTTSFGRSLLTQADAAAARVTLGAGTSSFDGTYSSLSGTPSTFTPSSHTHGNISNEGAIGVTANLPLITTTSGVITVGAFGTTASTFCQGNDSRLSDARTPTAHNQAWSTITSTPTTLAGYGITDSITAATAASTYLARSGGQVTNWVDFGTGYAFRAGGGNEISCGSNIPLNWTSGTDARGTKDTGIGRNAAGVVEVNNGTLGTLRDLSVRGLTTSDNIVAGGLTINPSNGSVTLGQTFAMVLQTANAMILRHGNSDLSYTRPVSATSGTYIPAGYGAFGFANNSNAIGVYLVPTAAGTLEVRNSTHGTAAITASSFNKITVTAPATSATLTLADGCSLITSGANSLTLTTTGSTNATLPSGTSTIVARDSTDTLTNKRIQRRIVSTTSASSLTPDISAADFYEYTALAAGLTISNPTGTPVNGELLNFRLQDNGVQRSIAWGADFRSMSATLPSATVANKVTRVLTEWNSTDLKWDCLAVSTEP